jgi:trans-AT polyketide synthase, acyltransferase and oxidoreductase domains
MSSASLPSFGSWSPGPEPPAFSAPAIAAAAARFRETTHIVQERATGRVGPAFGGVSAPPSGGAAHALLATLPPVFPEWLGDRAFLHAHGVRFPYAVGAMANGITSSAMVVAAARAGCLAFFGSAGLAPARVAAAIGEIQASLGSQGPGWGVNLIHSPNEPQLEEALADLYLQHGVVRVCASAFMGLTPAVVRYAASGLSADASGRVVRRNHVFAKISRPEVAQRFLSPAPADVLDALVARGAVSKTEAALAARVPLAADITVEADSGGHTDNRPLPSLFPAIATLRDQLFARHGFATETRLGAAGGLGTPSAVAAAFALGAAYVMTGSVNQAAVESGLSPEGRQMLAEAGLADVMMAPAADMFELGVKVQVLRRGTMFGVRALRLFELYQAHGSLDTLPAAERERLERELFKATLEEVWTETRRFFEERDPRELARAEREPKHKMALVFRWYLGKASHWAIAGEPERRLDYQIWCGPAMGAFNAWTAGSFLAEPANRTVAQIAANLLEGAAAVSRGQQLRSAGVPVPAAAFDFRPRRLA